MRRLAGLVCALTLVSAALAGTPHAARAAVDTAAAPPTPAAQAQAWHAAEADLAAARATQAALGAQPADPNPLLEARRQLSLAAAAFQFREAARAEQVVVYAAAVDPAAQAEIQDRMSPAEVAPLRATVAGLRALWRSAGITDLSLVRVRRSRSFATSATAAELLGYYRAAGARHGIDWTYLASINYVESDFGRVLGPSSAGALGPMQFMPATWSDYGAGGDVMSPRDSIEAAARYLRAMGGPANMDRAIYRYNNDTDYVDSIQGFAGAFRADPGWVDRLYYWGTAG